MKPQKLTFLVAACFLGSTALAQAPTQREAKPRQTAAPGQAVAPAPATQKAPRRQVILPHAQVLRQTVLAQAGTKSLDLGTVANLVVDSADGSVSHVVVMAGAKSAEPGKLRAVPFSDLVWTMTPAGDAQAMLRLDARAYEALPSFDPSKLDQLAGAAAVGAAAKRVAGATSDQTAAEKAEAVKTARAATAAPARSVLLTKMAGLEVFAPSEREAFGAAKVFDIDCSNGRVAFAEVAVSGAEYLVPFELLKVRSAAAAAGAASTLSLVAPTNAEGMVGAPTIDAMEQRTAQNPRFRKSVYKHYNVKPPTPRPLGEGMGRKAPVRKKAGAAREAVREVKNTVRTVVDKR